jgi:hypothetical protein
MCAVHSPPQVGMLPERSNVNKDQLEGERGCKGCPLLYRNSSSLPKGPSSAGSWSVELNATFNGGDSNDLLVGLPSLRPHRTRNEMKKKKRKWIAIYYYG